MSVFGPHAHVGVSATQEAYNDALYFKDEALRAFKLGILSLEERAQVYYMHRNKLEQLGL
jgi:arginine decarboxylase